MTSVMTQTAVDRCFAELQAAIGLLGQQIQEWHERGPAAFVSGQLRVGLRRAVARLDEALDAEMVVLLRQALLPRLMPGGELLSEADDEARRFVAVMASLPVMDQAIGILFFLGRLREVDVAEAIGKSPPNIDRQLKKIRMVMPPGEKRPLPASRRQYRLVSELFDAPVATGPI